MSRYNIIVREHVNSQPKREYTYNRDPLRANSLLIVLEEAVYDVFMHHYREHPTIRVREYKGTSDETFRYWLFAFRTDTSQTAVSIAVKRV